MAGIKIVDLPAVGRNLAASDLFEMSLAGGTGSRKITGQEILNSAILTIGSTAIASGTAGRVLFEGAGNVLQESSSLFWDNTNSRLGIGTSTPFGSFDVRDGDIFATISSNANLRSRLTYQGLYVSRSTDGTYTENIISTTSAWLYNSRNSHSFFRDGTNLFNVGVALSSGLNINSNGNILIGTTTDAGYKLDVNGTARVVGNTLLDAGIIATSGATTRLQGSLNYFSHNRLSSSGTFGFDIRQVGVSRSFWRYNDSSGNTEFGSNNYGIEFYGNNTLRATLTAGGNLLINTTTDAGYKLDVNGTARVQTTLDINTGSGITASGANNPIVINSNYWGNGDGLVIASKNTADSSPKLILRTNSTGSSSLQFYNNGNKSYIRQVNLSGVGNASVYLFQIDNRAAKFAVTPDDSTTDASFFGKAIWDGGSAATFRASSATQTANILNVQNNDGTTTHFSIKSNGRVNMSSLPTSSAGLSVGDIWNDGGTLKIV